MTVCVPRIPGRDESFYRAASSVVRQRLAPGDHCIFRSYVDVDRKGAAFARNKLLSEVTTEWTAWLDDDDELLDHHLAVLLSEAKRTDSDLIYSIPTMLSGSDPTAVSVNGEWVKPWGVPFGPEQEHHLRNAGSFIPITHLVRTKMAKDAGGFPNGRTLSDGRYQGEDERYLIALLDAGASFLHVPETTWLWNGGHGGNTAGRSDQR